MGDGVDDGFVDDVEIVGGGVATVRAFVRWHLHEAGDEGDIGIDLVGGGPANCEVRHGEPHGGGHDGIDHGCDPKSFVGCGCVEVRAQVGTGHGRSDKTGPLRRAPGSIHEREGTGQG